jgi:DMSO/TMAO reductase YedYZ molybdopterin-dependent catalytic subunit
MTDADNANKNRARAEIRRREFLLGVLASCGLAPRYLSGQGTFHANGVAIPQVDRLSSDEAVKKLMTANNDFFIRNHFRVPQMSAENWNLEIGGLVANPLKFSYPDLLLASSVRRPLTLECAGNVSGGAGVSTALWSGLSMAELLKQAGAHADATTVILYGADAGEGEDVPAGTHYARSIPLEKAMDPSTLLAYEMNGEPLPPEHGFPLRAVVSGWYGMDSVKWLTRVEVSREPFNGYFQRERYVAVQANGERLPITRMRVSSKFLRPLEDEEIRTKSYRIEGLAWAGERKISKVELRFDGKGEWQAAVLGESPVAMVWTPWTFAWSVPRTGQCAIEVRATDGEGNSQPSTRDRNRKDDYELNTSQRVSVKVIAGKP